MSDVRVLKVLAFTTLPAPSPPSKDLAAWYSFSDSKKPLCVFTICHSVVFSGWGEDSRFMGRRIIQDHSHIIHVLWFGMIQKIPNKPATSLHPPTESLVVPAEMGPDCKAPMMDLGKSLKVARGWKYHHHPSLSCFPSGTLQTKCTKNRNQHTDILHHTTTSMQGWTKIFLHNPHVPWFLVLLSRDEHEPQPATGSPGSHWVPPRAALVAFLRRFTLEKPGLELIMQRSTAGITDISQRSSDVSASGNDSQKVSKGDCWKVGDSQHQNQS